MVAVLSACHQDICERDEKVDQDCGLDHTRDQTKTCKDSLDSCSADDLDALQAYQDCKDEVGATACEPTTQAFVDAIGCLEALQLSDPCHVDLAGIGG